MRGLLLFIIAVVHAGAVRAQDIGEAGPWRFGRGFTPQVGGQWGVGIGLGLGWAKAPPPGPSPIGALLRVTGRYGITTGSTEASLVLEAPAASRNWKFLALLRGERLQRTPFFGFNNEVRWNDSIQKAVGNLYYRYSLLRATGLGVVQRRVAGPLWLMVGGQIRHYRSTALKQRPSLFEQDITAGMPDTATANGSELRAGLLFDTRDDWSAATRGMLVELLMAPGRLHFPAGGRTLPYTRYLLSSREFLPLTSNRRTILALRQRVSLASDSLPFFLAYEQTTTWLPNDGISGARSMRLRGAGRELASNVAIASVELRRKLMVPSDNPDRAGGLWAFTFFDGALLWEPRETASLRRNEWTIGAGLRIQFSQASIVGADFGVSDAGPHVALISGFAF